jgi:hypothetical protein
MSGFWSGFWEPRFPFLTPMGVSFWIQLDPFFGSRGIQRGVALTGNITSERVNQGAKKPVPRSVAPSVVGLCRAAQPLVAVGGCAVWHHTTS